MNTVPQAGAIAFSFDGPVPLFLVVTAKKDPSHWIFPKGHVEQGETFEAAAVRELKEEAGIVGQVTHAVGSLSFRSSDEDVEVTYFLIRASPHRSGGELREARWLDFASARERLTFDDSKELLDRAAALIETG